MFDQKNLINVDILNPRNTKKSSSDSLFNIVSNVGNNINKKIIVNDNNNLFESTNSIKEKNEIEIYKNLINSSDYQINKLKNLIEIQNEKINSLKINNNLSFFQENNYNKNNNKLKIEIEKYNKKIKELKEDYNFLHNNLNNEKEYFKNKLKKIKENSIEISEHNRIKKEIENNNDKKAVSILDKLVFLKNKLNECSKFINNNTSTLSPILSKESNYLTTSNLLESKNKKIQEIKIISYNENNFLVKNSN